MRQLPTRNTLSQLVIIISLMSMLVFYQKTHLDFTYWGWWILTVAFCFLGIPHGALDFDLYCRHNRPNIRQAIMFVLGYIVIASVMFMLWLWLPALCFLVFVAISVWHFRNDWQEYCESGYSLCLAIFILCAPGVFAFVETQQYLQWLYLSESWAQVLIMAMQLGFLCVCLVLLVALCRKKLKPDFMLVLEIFALISLLLTTSVLVYFLVYFISLHSMWYYIKYCEQFQLTPVQLVNVSTPWVVLTMIFAAGLYAFWGQSIEQGVLAMMFIGLFALTVPHMILVERSLK